MKTGLINDAAPAAQPKEDDMDENKVREIVDERLKELGVYPLSFSIEEPEPPTSFSTFDDEVGATLQEFTALLQESLNDEQKATVSAAHRHYISLTEPNEDGGELTAQQYTRAFREALNHAPESQERNMLRSICMFLDGGLPSPIRSREDVYGYVKPVEGDEDKEPSHR